MTLQNDAEKDLKIPYLAPAKGGRYRYQRRVPPEAQEFVGKKKWDLSLGSDYLKAVDQARALAKEHDAILGNLKSPEDRERVRDERVEATMALAVAMRPGMQRRIGENGQLSDVSANGTD